MTAMTKVNVQALAALTVGQVAEQLDVTVRTLHHYDEIGLLVPSERSPAGYRYYAQEAEQRWGKTEGYRESQRRAAEYTKEQWGQCKVEVDANHGDLASAMNDGELATSERAMAAAEQHRLLIEKWFNPVPYPMHRGMSDMYVTDPRFTKTYEDIAPGLAQYIRDAIHANADRAAHLAGGQS